MRRLGKTTERLTEIARAAPTPQRDDIPRYRSEKAIDSAGMLETRGNRTMKFIYQDHDCRPRADDGWICTGRRAISAELRGKPAPSVRQRPGNAERTRLHTGTLPFHWAPNLVVFSAIALLCSCWASCSCARAAAISRTVDGRRQIHEPRRRTGIVRDPSMSRNACRRHGR